MFVLYAGSPDQLPAVVKVVLNFPGGGFVAMNPQCHEDYLRQWAKRLGPHYVLVSVDYGKAPEFPYPWALEECWAVYKRICETRGQCIGLNGLSMPWILLAGDSAGGNLVVGVTYKCLEYEPLPNELPIPKPIALLLAYPALDFTITSWMTEQSATLIRSESRGNLTDALWTVKDHTEKRVRPLSQLPDRKSVRVPITEWKPSFMPNQTHQQDDAEASKLLMTSWTCYYNDRLISVDLVPFYMLLSYCLVRCGPWLYCILADIDQTLLTITTFHPVLLQTRC